MTVKPQGGPPPARSLKSRSATVADDANLGLIRLLYRACGAVERTFARHSADGGLTPLQSAILAEIADATDVDRADISRRTGIDLASVNDAIRRFEASGLVELPRPMEASRPDIVRITGRGRAALEDTAAIVGKTERQLGDRLGAFELLVLVHMLGRLSDASTHPVQVMTTRRSKPCAN